ncbi:MAG TPA: LemA family protein [Tepidisphaeraceae bacterium]|jgi:LemA protein|nr:LemA family protein [Tepidisphaeraceae bacterium]
MRRTPIIAAAAIVLFILIVVPSCSYNSLVHKSQAVDQQWAQVQSVYQRRADLIPNLVSTVSGAANFEKSTLTEVTNARASVGRVNLPAAPTDPARLAEYEQAQGQLSSALSRLLVVAENYPDLKATANFRDLQAQLEGTENRISVERGRFNDAVANYNTSIKTFPNVIVAGRMGFQTKPYFNAAPEAQTVPKVQFDNGNKPSR